MNLQGSKDRKRVEGAPLLRADERGGAAVLICCMH